MAGDDNDVFASARRLVHAWVHSISKCDMLIKTMASRK
ncbi:hypothetical protein Arad_4772 [Rhizobium rhizogenes K84]|uniref:Uncharacterized protein n=1 Tax=Rhizobium rhizogenes (strain K84 / ATCC BAA-868) TaxID=311403 RepID=B9JE53_RHIR8|nr:hypothetical protein Arad_4772 [Rhizobium rhizogenes K84]